MVFIFLGFHAFSVLLVVLLHYSVVDATELEFSQRISNHCSLKPTLIKGTLSTTINTSDYHNIAFVVRILPTQQN